MCYFGCCSGVATSSIFGNWILRNRKNVFWPYLRWLLFDIKREYCPFNVYLKFDNNGGYFGFKKRETFLFSRRKFLIHYCALYIAHCWRKNVVTIHQSLESAFLLYYEILREFIYVYVRVEIRVCELYDEGISSWLDQ